MENKIIYHNVTESPFTIHGLLPVNEENGFRRIPNEVYSNLRAPARNLNVEIAGGRVRFRTDATSISIKAIFNPGVCSVYVNNCLRCGLDVYREFGGKEIFETTFYSWDPTIQQSSIYQTCPLHGNGMRDFTIYLPCYGNINSLEVGFPEGAKIESARPYKFQKPVVFLGSSITQGAVADRPGITYQGYLSRRLDFDYINLGFSGSCRAEKELMEYITTLPMSVFVYDYDYNAPTVEFYEQTHKRGYEIIREKHPELPIIIVTKPDFRLDSPDDVSRRIIAQKTYHYGIENGDKNIYFIDGSSLFGGVDREDCTVDGCHPTDVGMLRIADAMTHTLHYALYKNR